MTKNIRYYRIADITIEVQSNLPITDSTFAKKFDTFRVKGPGEDTISLHHHFELPNLDQIELGKVRYRKVPWTIYEQSDGWLYVGIMPD
ncbi:MAG: hypothetical protein U9R53_05515, partial [Chloroflexota bacterium]|nr:hypothetical protein [Chloroflexota bacterium]